MNLCLSKIDWLTWFDWYKMLKTFISILFLSTFVVGCGHQELENDSTSLLKAADRMQEKGNIQSAIPIYQKALEKPGAAKLSIYLKLGHAYIAGGDLEAARKTFEQALEVDENNQAKTQLARCYLLAGKPDAAIIIFQEIIDKNQSDSKSFNGLGVAYDLKHNHKQAQEYYKKALQIRPDDAEVISNLGLSFAFSGDFSESLKRLQPLGEQVGASPKQRHNLAVVYVLSKQDQKAHDLFSKDLDHTIVEENIKNLKKVSITENPGNVNLILAEEKMVPLQQESESQAPAELELTVSEDNTDDLKNKSDLENHPGLELTAVEEIMDDLNNESDLENSVESEKN